EPYSISMVIQDYQRTHPGSLGSNIQIIATDISSSILAHAKEARYDKIAIGRGLAEDFKTRYFQKAGEQWEVIEPIRKRIQFRQINLMQSYALMGRFDIIFCRNVLIYFSGEAKQDILERMTGSLNQNGHLVLGGSESPGNAGRHYSMERHGGGMVYKLKS
ncbi:MAG TPA: chemotaxis protein, partial [Gammaproteobacteria bacterium]|nr:chemotaxis protein [Gammaproteobacteria bacterium]